MKNPRELTLLECEVLLRDDWIGRCMVDDLAGVVESAQKKIKEYVAQQECKKIVPPKPKPEKKIFVLEE